MNPFRILRDHLMASGLIFTDKQMADTVSESFRKIKDLESRTQSYVTVSRVLSGQTTLCMS